VQVAQALADLINLLPNNREHEIERHLVEQLITNFHHRPTSVRLALRIAQSGELIVRKRKKTHAIELLRVLRPAAATTGHTSCLIKLTESGLMWKCARPVTDKDKLSSPVGEPRVDNTFYLYGSNIVSTGGEAINTINDPVWQSSQGSNIEDLARELTKLCAELRKGATDPEHDLIIADLAHALIAAKEGDSQKVMTNLTKLDSQAAHLRKWVMDTATAIGIPVAIAWIKQALHLPPGG
jgi:hypothetical protein